jgi:hypothetical protein
MMGKWFVNPKQKAERMGWNYIPYDNASLDRARLIAHAKFDSLWINYSRVTRMPREEARSRAYSWLSEMTGIPEMHCHMSQMSEKQCLKVVDLVNKNTTVDLFDYPARKYNRPPKKYSRTGRRKAAFYYDE